MKKCLYVKKIEFCNSEELNGMGFGGGKAWNVPTNVKFTEIPAEGLVEATVEGGYKDNMFQYVTTVSVRTCSALPADSRQLAFRLTAVDGSTFLVGSYMRPFPVITVKDPRPARPEESRMRTVSVEWKSLEPMLEIV